MQLIKFIPKPVMVLNSICRGIKLQLEKEFQKNYLSKLKINPTSPQEGNLNPENKLIQFLPNEFQFSIIKFSRM